MNFSVPGLLAAVAPLAGFGGIALLMWVDQLGKTAKRQMEHAERLRALELGRELPDAEVARANASGSRAWAASLVGWFVPLFALMSGVGATAMVLTLASVGIHLPLLCTIWGVCGLISVVAVHASLSAIRHQKQLERAAPSSNMTAALSSKLDAPLDTRNLELEVVGEQP